MTAPFRDNVVVLTGASAGIGKAIALQLADQGACLMLAARDEARLDEVARECRARGARAECTPTDVAQEEDCERLIGSTVASFGRVDTLINNAGISMVSRFDQIGDLRAVERIMRVNYFGSVYCTHYALPYLKLTRGRIVGVSSLTGKTGVPTRSAYAASKHAMAGFFDSLRIELMESGVSVTMIYPGFVATEIRTRGIGPGGGPAPHGNRGADTMSADECARLTIAAAAERRREVVMTLQAKVGMWLKLLAPDMVDGIARRAQEKRG